MDTYFFEKEGVVVSHCEDINKSLKMEIINFIDKYHYLKFPFNKDGTPNPYHYCYGMGYTIDNHVMSSAMCSGFSCQAFQERFDILKSKLGVSWILKNVALIWRIVAWNQEDADLLLQEYEKFAIKRGLKILYSLPTKKEKDAVCNHFWFKENGFKEYGKTKNKEATIFVKVIGEIPQLITAGVNNGIL